MSKTVIVRYQTQPSLFLKNYYKTSQTVTRFYWFSNFYIISVTRLFV